MAGFVYSVKSARANPFPTRYSKHYDLHGLPCLFFRYALVFSLFVNYLLDIPRVTQSYIMGIPVTGKTLTYLLGLQVISTSKETAICGMCSLVAGVLCRWNVLFVRSLIRVPDWMARLCSTTVGRLLKSSAPQEGPFPMGATLDIQRQQQAELLEMQLYHRRATTTARHPSLSSVPGSNSSGMVRTGFLLYLFSYIGNPFLLKSFHSFTSEVLYTA